MQELIDVINMFREERDWRQFHNPKDLALGLSIEASELLEQFLWKNGDEISAVVAARQEEIGDELADVLIYALMLASDLNMDPEMLIQQKVAKNARKYPVEKAKGKSDKYTVL